MSVGLGTGIVTRRGRYLPAPSPSSRAAAPTAADLLLRTRRARPAVSATRRIPHTDDGRPRRALAGEHSFGRHGRPAQRSEEGQFVPVAHGVLKVRAEKAAQVRGLL